MTTRRAFLARVASGAGSIVVGAGVVGAQVQSGPPPATLDTTNLFAMDQAAARTVKRPPKPGAKPSMSRDERDDVEHHIRCQCGCTLDVYTCRTTDFSCKVSPAMHRDIMALVDGGYGAQEILDAFVSTYGERALMAPKKSGFNLVGWLTPGIALVVGGVAIALLLRRLGAERPMPVVAGPRVDATADELARVEAAVRGDDGTA